MLPAQAEAIGQGAAGQQCDASRFPPPGFGVPQLFIFWISIPQFAARGPTVENATSNSIAGITPLIVTAIVINGIMLRRKNHRCKGGAPARPLSPRLANPHLPLEA